MQSRLHALTRFAAFAPFSARSLACGLALVLLVGGQTITGAAEYRFELTGTISSIMDPGIGVPSPVAVGDTVTATVTYDTDDFGPGVNISGDGLDYAAPAGLELTYTFSSGFTLTRPVTKVRARNNNGTQSQWNYSGAPGVLFQANDPQHQSFDATFPVDFSTIHSRFVATQANFVTSVSIEYQVGNHFFYFEVANAVWQVVPNAPETTHYELEWVTSISSIMGPLPPSLAGITVGESVVARMTYNTADFGTGVNVSGDVLDYAAPAGLQMTYEFASGVVLSFPMTFVRAGQSSSADQWNFEGTMPGMHHLWQVNDTANRSYDNPLPTEFDLMHDLFFVEQGNFVSPGGYITTGGGMSSTYINFVQGTFTVTPRGEFVRGDCNQSGSVNIADVLAMLSSLFSGGATPECLDACDVNDSETFNISDPIALLNFLFSGGPTPPAPFGAGALTCGVDPDGAQLDCQAYGACP